MKKEITINTQSIINTFKELVSIDSPSLEEKELNKYLVSKFKELEINLIEDDVGDIIGGNCGNLYGYIKGDESLKPIILSGHTDTVEPSRGKTAVIHEDGKITSDGSTILGADDLSGLTAIYSAIKAIKKNNIKTRPIELLFFVAEEIYGLGSKNFDYSKLKSKEAYILDSTGPVGKAAFKAPTLISFEITVKGESGHSSTLTNYIPHSIAIISEAIGKIKIGRVDSETTANIGVISGGLASNIVPEYCTVKGEVRSLNHGKAIKLIEEIKKKFIETTYKYNGRIEINSSIDIIGYETPLDHPVVKRFEKACEELKIHSSMLYALGGSDNNNLQQHGINGIVLANAMNKPHSTEEYTYISELEKITAIVIKLIVAEEVDIKIKSDFEVHLQLGL